MLDRTGWHDMVAIYLSRPGPSRPGPSRPGPSLVQESVIVIKVLHTGFTGFAALAGILLTVTALAHGFVVGGIYIQHPWARATSGEGITTGSVYMVLSNNGTEADRLIGVASSVAHKVELHVPKLDNGEIRMREDTGVDLPLGSTVRLIPGGPHIILIGLKSPLRQGGTFPLTLTFEKAGRITVVIIVQGSKDVRPDHDHEKKSH
ncbi:MAG: copper chaperone PCu(A)C [Rhodospirillaceae bacterium]